MGRKSKLFAFAFLMLFGILLINFSTARQADCLLDKPIELWNFDNVSDGKTFEKCYNYNATPIGDYQVVSGKYDNSLLFDGINSFVDAGTSINGTYPQFSASLWVLITSEDFNIKSLVRRGYYYTNEFFDMNDYSNNSEVGMVSVGLSSPTSLSNGSWHNVIVTFNGTDSNLSMYFDGEIVESNIGVQTQLDETQAITTFGANYDFGWLLNGQIDEYSFYNRTLSGREVKDLFNPLNLNKNLSIVLYVSQYPYVDFNTTYNVKLKLLNNQTEVTDGLIIGQITELNGINTTFEMFYNGVDGYYETNLLFDKVGDFPFIIEANGYQYGYTNATGTFLVRKPYYVDVELFKNTLADSYVNDFGYVTAEFLGKQKINPTLETFMHPLSDSRFIQPTFHANYNSGKAELKLFEKNTYALRFFDGTATFESTYSKPNITKSFGTNIYLSQETLNAQNVSLKYVLNEKDLHPYRWLANWILFILLGLSIIVGIFVFFIIPDKPYIALVLTLLVGIGAIAMRIFLWFWFGW